MTTPLGETSVAVAIVFPTAFVGLLASGVGVAWAQFITVIMCSIVGSGVAMSFDETIGGSAKRVTTYFLRGIALSIIFTFIVAWLLQKHFDVNGFVSMIGAPVFISLFQNKLLALAGKKIEGAAS